MAKQDLSAYIIPDTPDRLRQSIDERAAIFDENLARKREVGKPKNHADAPIDRRVDIFGFVESLANGAR